MHTSRLLPFTEATQCCLLMENLATHRNVSIANLSSVQGAHVVKRMSMSPCQNTENTLQLSNHMPVSLASAAVQAYTCLGAEPRLDSSISKALSGL